VWSHTAGAGARVALTKGVNWMHMSGQMLSLPQHTMMSHREMSVPNGYVMVGDRPIVPAGELMMVM